MSAEDTDALINNLLVQTSATPQPSFGGLSAPPDPQQLQGLLEKLRQQQYQEAAARPTGGEYGYLHDAGNLDAVRTGQTLGNLLSGLFSPKQSRQQASDSPPPSFGGLQAPPDPEQVRAQISELQKQKFADAYNAPNTGDFVSSFRDKGKQAFGSVGQQIGNMIAQPQDAPALTNQQAITQAILKGRQAFNAMINAGVDPDVANLNTFKLLNSLGVPGADGKLAEAQIAVLKNEATRQGAAKDKGEAGNYGDLQTDRDARLAMDQGKANYTARPDLSNPEYFAQQEGGPNGRVVFEKRGDKLPLPPMTPAQDAAMDNAVNMVGTNRIGISDALSRMSGPQRFDFLSRLGAKYPDYNTPGFKAKTALVQAYTSGSQGQAAIKMENSANHSDMVIQAGQALDNGDLPTLNRIANAIGVQTGSLTTPKAVYDAIVPIYAAEVNSALVKGGGGEAERMDRVKALSSDLPQAARQAAAQGIQGMLRAQASNMEQTYRKASGNNDFYDLYPGLRTGDAPSANTGRDAARGGESLPPVDQRGWTLHQDAKGNQAYVSPDGKQFQPVGGIK